MSIVDYMGVVLVFTQMELAVCQLSYLGELCRFSREELVKWITSRLHELEETIYPLTDSLKLESYRETLGYIIGLLENKLSNNEKPVGYKVANTIV